MENDVSKKRPPPYSLRIPDGERKEIERLAKNAGLSLSAYFRASALSQSARKIRHPQPDRKQLAQLLGQLGRVGNNLNQLTRTLHIHGSVEIPELTIALNDLHVLREAIMKALGYKDNGDQAS